jgi:hypothetical protein
MKNKATIGIGLATAAALYWIATSDRRACLIRARDSSP